MAKYTYLPTYLHQQYFIHLKEKKKKTKKTSSEFYRVFHKEIVRNETNMLKYFSNNISPSYLLNDLYNSSSRVCKDFEIKHLGEYHGLYAQSDILMSTYVFNNLGNMCVNKIYELNPENLCQPHD